MNARAILLTILIGFFGASMCFAGEANMGTWKLNEAKSSIAPGATKNHTVVYEAAGDEVKITVDGMSGDGKPVHNVWKGKFDGKVYPVTGDPTQDARSYKRIDDRTLELTGMKGGKALFTGRIAVSADGKTRTVTIAGTDAKGDKVSSSAVYDKQ